MADYRELKRRHWKSNEGAMTIKQMIDLGDSMPSPGDGDWWGRWQLDADRLCLVHQETGYEIDLESVNTSAQMLDWIFQVTAKTWHTDQDTAGLIAAFRDLFDPQANLCSCGMSYKINPKKLLDKKIGTR